MVSLKEMHSSLENFRDHGNYVAVFLGGTSGIGEYTVRAFARRATSARIYIVGRNITAAEKIIDDCATLSPSSEFEFIQQDVALLKDGIKVAAKIKEKEDRVDLLFMTPDYLSFGGRDGEDPAPTLALNQAAQTISREGGERRTANAHP